MPGFIDPSCNTVFADTLPSSIVSAVPSLTELLFDLGLDDEVTGITKFCIHPKSWFLSKTKIGGTKNLDIDRIHQLKPDLIIANKEENTKEQIGALASQYNVLLTDINDISQACEAIHCIGTLTHKSEQSENIIASIKQRFIPLNVIQTKVTACYLIWRKPYMTIGHDTFIHSMMNAAGFENVFNDQLRYPAITLEVIREKNPEYILLSSEPFPFGEKHIAEIKEQVPGATCLLVDGEMFSWYGSRMLYAPSYFLNLWQHGLHRK